METMEIKGFGSYTSVEEYLATLTADEKNELYMSGQLDEMLDKAERATKRNNWRRRKGGATNEVLQQ